jgi:signal transduction histidine kinase
MSSLLKARAAFVIAIGLLLACALIVYGTDRGFFASVQQVEHTQHVQVLLGETESAIAAAARARLTYVFNGDEQALAQYSQSVSQIHIQLAALRRATADDSVQQLNCDRLERAVNDRIQLWEKSISLRNSAAPESPGQAELTRQSVASADEITAITQHMRAEEDRLLQNRSITAKMSYFLARAFRITTFFTAVLLLFWHYRLVREHLQAREAAEQEARGAAEQAGEAELKARAAEKAALESNREARHLSARILHLQDEERRRLARDLHDSTGQYLAAAKMLLASVTRGHEDDKRYAECMTLLDRSLKEVRTLSHLLHPSGLEETGFPTVARWYAEEFSKRSGIQVTVNIPNLAERLPGEIETALFRILQEALGNVHRHSKSSSAEVTFISQPPELLLTIKDRGVGIRIDVLERFRSFGSSGVGLAAMRERVRELRGTLDLESNGNGTLLRVTIPAPEQSANRTSA